MRLALKVRVRDARVRNLLFEILSFFHVEGSDNKLERLRFTFTPNGKREFVPRDQVFPLFFVYRLLLLHKNK